MDSQNVKYKISINRFALDGKLTAGDPRWGAFTHGFENVEISAGDILYRITDGHAYCTCLSGGRSKDSFTAAQHIALDFDTNDFRSSMDYLSQNPIVRMYGGMLHTTPSHTPEAPRARAIFLLDEIVTDISQYEKMLAFMIELFATDQSCSDATRFFYGSKGAAVDPIFNVLPISHLRTMYSRYIELKPKNGIITPENKKTSILRMSDYRTAKSVPSGDNIATVEAFNAAHHIEDVLRRYGYTKVSNRTWSRPGKEDSAGVHILHGQNKTYNHSSNDPMFAKRDGKNQPADPFDYYVKFEHNGDIASALKSLEMAAAA